MIRLGILGSTRGTNMLAILAAIDHANLPANIAMVATNKQGAGILHHAVTHGLPHQYLDSTGLSREEYDGRVSALFQQSAVDLIVLTGYMRILSPVFVNEWENRIINVHPSFLPAFAGLMDLNAHRAVLDSGAAETGCSVHYVTEEVDAGTIILQKRCSVLPNDTAETLKARVQQLEGPALVEAIHQLISSLRA
jgi:phosphoribosylglycinamide formyltransferase-1